MNKLKMHSVNKVDENIEKIGALFPNALTEVIKGYKEDGSPIIGYAIDFDVLRQELSDFVVEGPEERYQFTWPDKRKSIVLANAPIAQTLRPYREESVDFDNTENLYIEGDNLDVLKLLQETYLGKVKMVYIDPPYNTGNDFIYEDDFAQDVDNYLANSGQYDIDGNRLVQNTESNGRFHTDWLNMIYPRLKIAKDLLADDGAIFISIDDNEAVNLKKVCDEVFGASNFVSTMIWRSSDNSNNNALTFSLDHNYILVYSKKPTWRPNFLNDPKKRIHFKNPDNDPKGPWFDGNPVNNPGLRVNLQYDITTPSGKIIKHPANGWRWSWETVQEKLMTGELRYSEDETRLIRRTYLCDMEGLPPSSLCIDFETTGHTRRAKYELKNLFSEIAVTDLFSTPKPTDLIKYLLALGSNSNAIIMDFFSGSATTAHAVMQANAEDAGNRKFIMVQLQEPVTLQNSKTDSGLHNICEIGKERIRRAGQKIVDEIEQASPSLDFGEDRKIPDIGFRVLKVDSTNMQDVYYNPGDYKQDQLAMFADNIKTDRTPEDLLFQVMLDLGVLLSSKIEETSIGGKKVFNVAGGYLLACFDNDITGEVITEIARKKPYYAVFRDSSIASDSVATNFEQIFTTYSPTTVRKVL